MQYAATHWWHTNSRPFWSRFITHFLDHTATHCNTLQHTATRCNTLQHIDSWHFWRWFITLPWSWISLSRPSSWICDVTHSYVWYNSQAGLTGLHLAASYGQVSCLLQRVAACCSVLQRVAVRCSVLQRVSACCNVLQCIAACCSVLQCVAVCWSVLHVLI